MQGTLCFDLAEAKPSSKVKLKPCHKLGGNQEWIHIKVSFVNVAFDIWHFFTLFSIPLDTRFS